MLKKPFLFFALFFVAGCVSSGKKEAALPAVKGPGVKWETKAQVRDFKNNKTNNLSIDVVAVKDSHLRLEVSALMGYSVASFVTTPQNVRMAIYPQKKFYFGPNTEEALRPLLGFPLDPNIFQSIVFDGGIKNWICEIGDDGLVSSCKRKTKQGEVVVTWQERKPTSRRIVIHGPQFEIEWVFKDTSVVNPVKAELFRLEPPSGYKVIPL